MTSIVALAAWLLIPATPAFAADSAAGRPVYVAKCQACHGATGRGDGPAARALPKAPRSFAASEFWLDLTNERLAATIGSGKPGTAMRGFPMEPAQMNDLVAYLRTFEPQKP